jgi:hypothetical protein
MLSRSCARVAPRSFRQKPLAGIALQAVRTRHMPPFGLFIRESRLDPDLRGLSAPERGKAMGTRWRLLTQAEKDSYKERARKITIIKKLKVKQPRRPSAFALFVRENYDKVRHLPFKSRLGELAQLYRNLDA